MRRAYSNLARQQSKLSASLQQHSCLRSFTCTAFDLPPAPISANIPMYCGPDVKESYVGEANSDFTHSAKDYLKLMTSVKPLMDMMHLYWYSEEKTMPMYDARALEAAEGLSKCDFFHKHGFVLLDHHSTMTASDWLASEYKPLKAHELGSAKPGFTQGETRLKQTYNQEIQALLQTVLPSAMDFMAPVRGIQRGPGSAYEKVYASVVHTDFPVDYDAFRKTNAWLGCDEHIKHLEEDTEAASYYMINLWRPVLPMKGPVRSTPLAMLHPATLDYKDLVTVDLIGGQFPEGQTYLHVRHRPEHKWFFYPDMTTDEVLVWKQAHFVKGEPLSRMPIPHTAFKHPTAKASEPRCSFEHRVAVFCSTPDGK